MKWIVNFMRKRHRFKLAETADEIIKVYSSGPISCMTGHRSVGSYADGDLRVAYLETIARKRVVARAVVWPKKRLYYRIYATNIKHHWRLQNSLAYRGYRQGRLKGAKVGLTYGLPSIDGQHGLIHAHNHVIIK